MNLLAYKFGEAAGYGTSAVAKPNIIIEQQKVKVDAISGATASSSTIMNAVENALLGKNY